MKWREAKRGPEQRAAVAEALRSTGTVKDAADQLGITRQYLHGLLKQPAFEGVWYVASGDTSKQGDTRDTSNGGDMQDTEDSLDSVARTHLKPLTYTRPGPTLKTNMSTQPMVVPETSKLTMEFPKRVKDWAEQKALAYKQSHGGRFAIAPIFVELAEREMAREEAERAAGEMAAPKKAKAKE